MEAEILYPKQFCVPGKAEGLRGVDGTENVTPGGLCLHVSEPPLWWVLLLIGPHSCHLAQEL